MSPLAFAWRSLTRQPARAALGVIGIAAVGALLFDMLMLSHGLVVSFSDLLDSVGFDVRVTASRSLGSPGPPIDDASEVVREIAGLAEVADVVPLRFGRATVEDRAGESIAVVLLGSRPRPGRNWTLLEGAPLAEPRPGEPPRTVLNRRLANTLDLSPGDSIRLRGKLPGVVALPEVEFEVAGIADFTWDTPDQFTVATTLGGFDEVLGGEGRDVADLLLIASSAGSSATAAVAAVTTARPELHVFSNEHLIRRFQVTDFSYFRQIAFVLSTITLFFAFLLVATLLTVSVNQRFAEIAALRALGFGRRRVVADLLCESALLVGSGGLLAIPLGQLLAGLLESILRSIPGIPARLQFFVFEPRSAVLYVVLLAGAGILAALYPVYLAARLPIAATLRREVVS